MKRFLVLVFAVLAVVGLCAQGVKPLPTLHVEGKWLTDMHGNHVVLHGVMDTPSAWFNSGRWGWSYDNNGRLRCLDYFEKVFTGLETAKCTVFRLHLEPAWTNDNSYNYPIASDQPSSATGEADIRHFNPARLTTYLRTLYFPLARKAMNHGMYVVMRPPGVCPHDLKVGDYYQQYLLNVWDIVTKNDSIRKYAGQISLELANEPVNLKNKNNQTDPKALHDYFQPIVNKIRENGFTGIIWVPGTGWQSNYADYARYPVEGYNIGYAVHDYNGWYGSDDKNISNVQTATTNKIRQFHNQVPVVDNYPVIITEVDWSPAKPGSGHYNEHGEWVESNYGTWATATTSKWGKVFKGTKDHFGNISMTISGTDCLLDVPRLLNDGSVVPAFGGLEEACGKACMDWYADYYNTNWPHSDDELSSEASRTVEKLSLAGDSVSLLVGETVPLKLVATFRTGRTEDVTARAYFDTGGAEGIQLNNGLLRASRQQHVSLKAGYTDEFGNKAETEFTVASSFFLFDARYVDEAIGGSAGVYNEKNHAMRPAADGQVGWRYDIDADMSGYKYLVVKLRQAQTCDARLNIYTDAAMTQGCYTSEPFGAETLIGIDLSQACYTSGPLKGSPLNTRGVRVVSFSGSGSGYMIVSEMYLTSHADLSPMPLSAQHPRSSVQTQPVMAFTLSGQLVGRGATVGQAVQGLRPGIYVVGGKKVVINK